MAYRSDYTIMVMQRIACLVSIVLMCEGMAQGQVLPDPVEARSATEATLLEAGANSQEVSSSRTDGQPGS